MLIFAHWLELINYVRFAMESLVNVKFHWRSSPQIVMSDTDGEPPPPVPPNKGTLSTMLYWWVKQTTLYGLIINDFQITSAALLSRTRNCWLIKKKILKLSMRRNGLPSGHGLVSLKIVAVSGLALTSGPELTTGSKEQRKSMEMIFPVILGKRTLFLFLFTAGFKKNPQLYWRKYHNRQCEIWSLSRKR